LAFVTDQLIRQNSKGKNSLDTVMNEFYHSYYQEGKGISEKDFITEINKASTIDLENLWDNYFYGTKNFYSLLKSTLKKSDFKLTKEHNAKYFAAHYGFFNQPGTNKALFIAPKSPTYKAGINAGDEVISINKIVLEKDNLNQWAKYFGGTLEVVFKKDGLLKTIKLPHSTKLFFPKVKLV
jgi:predicted metalloprotease with PDZ domain